MHWNTVLALCIKLVRSEMSKQGLFFWQALYALNLNDKLLLFQEAKHVLDYPTKYP